MSIGPQSPCTVDRTIACALACLLTLCIFLLVVVVARLLLLLLLPTAGSAFSPPPSSMMEALLLMLLLPMLGCGGLTDTPVCLFIQQRPWSPESTCQETWWFLPLLIIMSVVGSGVRRLCVCERAR
jgi:hypothetical protein